MMRTDRPHRGRHDRLWAAAAAGAVLLGVVASTVAAQAIVRSDADKSHQAVASSATDIALTVQGSIQQEQDLTVSASAFVAGDNDATQAQFRQWTVAVRAFSRYPELESLGEIVMVSASQLPGLVARLAGTPAAPVTTSRAFTITPPGIRPYYCLEAVSGVRPGQTALPPGFDYCQTAPAPLLMASRSSGAPSYIPFRSGRTTALAVGTPIYANGADPVTVAARGATFVGWTGALFNPAVLLQHALRGHRDDSVSVHFHEGSYVATFHAGTAPRSGQAVAVALTPSWSATTTAPAFSDGILAHQNSMVVLVGGVALSLLIGLLVFVLGTGRSRALALVHRRTDELHFLAYHDALTGLPNRTLILDRLAQMLARAQRQGGQVTVLLVDIHAFRDINETMGHGAGDELLVEVGARLLDGLRRSDSIGRLAGDEFVILVDGSPPADGPGELALRVLALIEPPFTVTSDRRDITLAVSIGIATGSRATPADLLRDAGIALGRAKIEGSPPAVVFSATMHDDADNRRSLDLSLNTALAAGEFFLLYQPTVDLATRRFTGAEALLRWNHRDRGVVSPNEFIPLLEANGLIVPVGTWVLEEACRQGARWAALGHPLMMSVNVSARQLEGTRLVDDVTAALAASGLDPGLLILELTETALMRDVQTTVEQLLQLKRNGVRIAIDDFGTGYSSLAYLSQFPIDVLKIDQSFVAGLSDTPEAAAIVHTLVQLGKLLGLETTAEGIETHEQWTMLQDEHVDHGQGYLFARPQPAAAIDLLLGGVPGDVGHTLMVN